MWGEMDERSKTEKNGRVLERPSSSTLNRQRVKSERNNGI